MKKLFSVLLALTLTLALASCGGQKPAEVHVDLEEFYADILEANEWPMLMPLEGETLESFYPGLGELELKQCLVNTAAISAVVGEIALVEAGSEADAQSVKDIFQARIDAQVDGGAFYPMTVEGWENDSHIEVQGKYVMLAAGEYADDAVEQFQALFR